MFKLQTTITSVIQGYFNKSPVLLGNMSYKMLPNKIIVRIPYFVIESSATPQTMLIFNPKIGSAIKTALAVKNNYRNHTDSVVSSTLTELELRFIQIRYPYLESSILNQYIAINTSKYNFNRIQKMLFDSTDKSISDSNVNLPATAAITGVKMELAGRLTTQRSIPRKTVSSAHIGNFNKVNMSQYASKNKLGSFTIKV